jgi:glycopeptide antibiotics resistance protein
LQEPGSDVGKLVVASAAFSVLVELLQFILPTGRQTSVTDVLMNVVGATAGYLAMLALRGLAQRVPAATGIPYSPVPYFPSHTRDPP